MWFTNLELYANGTIADGEPLPFAARFCSPGWLPGIKTEEHLKELRAYFCAVDGDGKLVMSKPEVFDMISGKKGREELAKSFKEGNRFIKKKWAGVLTQQIGKPFEGFIKYMESKKYSEPPGGGQYGATNTDGGEGKAGDDGEHDGADNDEDEEDENTDATEDDD